MSYQNWQKLLQFFFFLVSRCSGTLTTPEGKRCYRCPKNFQCCIKWKLFCRCVTVATFWRACHCLWLWLIQCFPIENGSIMWLYRRTEMKPSACSMIKKNTNTGIRFWISVLNYTLLGANGPLSLNLSVLINKMERKDNVQGYCNDHKCVRGEAEWRVSASWHSFSLGRWIKFWRWRVAMLHNKVNALKVMELNAPKWLKW